MAAQAVLLQQRPDVPVEKLHAGGSRRRWSSLRNGGPDHSGYGKQRETEGEGGAAIEHAGEGKRLIVTVLYYGRIPAAARARSPKRVEDVSSCRGIYPHSVRVS